MQKPFQKIVLANGVRLILVPMAGVSSVATSVLVEVGSRYETPEINGISHFLEHMTFKGTEKFPTTDEVNIVERYGGLQNAYTDVDVTSFHNKVLSEDWRLGLEVNKELALYPRLEEKHIEKERGVILEEMKRYDDEPEARLGEAYHQMLYPGTRLGQRTIGTRSSILASQGQALRSYFKKWYRPERIVVIVAGSQLQVSSMELQKQAEEYFANFQSNLVAASDTAKRGDSGDWEKVIESQDQPTVRFVSMPEISQAHLVLGVRTFSRGSADRFGWNLFNLLMGVSFTSRLFRQIREKQGLCYHIRSSSSNYDEVGSWEIATGVATEKVAAVTQAVLEQLRLVVDKGITQNELDVAKKRLKTLLAFRSEDPEFMTEYYGRQELFGLPMLTLEEYLAKIAAITVEEVNSLTRKYLRTETLNLAVVWNRPADDKLGKTLKI